MKTCVSLSGTTVQSLIEEVQVISSKTDCIEFRIDLLNTCTQEDITTLIHTAHENDTPCIVTARNMENQIELLEHACTSEADYIDIEVEAGKEAITRLNKNKKNTKVIVSLHDYESTPAKEELEILHSQLASHNADIVKLVTTAQSILDCFEMFSFMEHKSNLIAFCMGIHGQMSRIFAPKFGSLWTYCCTTKEIAPGQITLTEMNKVYNIQRMQPTTKMLGVIGAHAENSRSKFMHNDGFNRHDVDNLYVPLKIRPDELATFMKKMRAFGFCGAAVTIPHKQAIMEHLDEIDETAQAIGAVNTVVNMDGKLVGYNTDYYGAIEALKEKTTIKGKKVLVVGAGGAARALLYGLNKEGANTTIINRTEEKASSLAQDFNVQQKGFTDKDNLAHASEVIINTTSVGMNPEPNNTILTYAHISENTIVMDMVYNPLHTKLIQEALKSGAIAITGDRMLIHQAMGQFEHWTKIKPQFEHMQEALARGVQ